MRWSRMEDLSSYREKITTNRERYVKIEEQKRVTLPLAPSTILPPWFQVFLSLNVTVFLYFLAFFTSHASLSLSVAGWTCVKILQAWDGIEEGKNQIILQRETLGIIYGDRLKVGRNLWILICFAEMNRRILQRVWISLVLTTNIPALDLRKP